MKNPVTKHYWQKTSYFLIMLLIVTIFISLVFSSLVSVLAVLKIREFILKNVGIEIVLGLLFFDIAFTGFYPSLRLLITGLLKFKFNELRLNYRNAYDELYEQNSISFKTPLWGSIFTNYFGSSLHALVICSIKSIKTLQKISFPLTTQQETITANLQFKSFERGTTRGEQIVKDFFRNSSYIRQRKIISITEGHVFNALLFLLFFGLALAVFLIFSFVEKDYLLFWLLAIAISCLMVRSFVIITHVILDKVFRQVLKPIRREINFILRLVSKGPNKSRTSSLGSKIEALPFFIGTYRILRGFLNLEQLEFIEHYLTHFSIEELTLWLDSGSS